MYSTALETTLLDAVTTIVMAPINAIAGLLWLLWQGCKLAAPYRKHIGLAIAFVAALVLCIAVPEVLFGLGLTVVYGLVFYPTPKCRKVVRA